MSEGDKRRKVRKPESPRVVKKAESRSQIPEEDKSEIRELPTAHSKLQNKKMEVHHHPEVEKKGLK